jgi:hypothetical protein
MGFRQSAWEVSQGTFLFLLHRPRQRSTIILTKLASGLIAFLVCASLPILLYGAWAAIPGHNPSPFEWSMTASSWWMAALSFQLYYGAFLSGLRPARWFGTRLLPLVAVSLVVLFFVRQPTGWLFDLLFIVALDLALVAAVCYVAGVRDYA